MHSSIRISEAVEETFTIGGIATYLPKYNFSFNKKVAARAISKRPSGLKIDTNSGPRIRTHHAVRVSTNPVVTTPYITKHRCGIQFSCQLNLALTN